MIMRLTVMPGAALGTQSESVWGEEAGGTVAVSRSMRGLDGIREGPDRSVGGQG